MESNTSEKAEGSDVENRVKTKPIKSFSLFNLSKWRIGVKGNEREQEQQQQKKKSLDPSHTVKKYMRMLFHGRGNGTQSGNRRQTASYSFSSASLMSSKGNNRTMMSGSYNKRDLIRGRRGELLFSAPASMRTSPTNSGHLRVSTAELSLSSASTSSSSSESTMEELQAAIQAAIAHCKSSSAIDREDKVNDS